MRYQGATFSEKTTCFICDFWWLILSILAILLAFLFTRCLWLPSSCPARIRVQNNTAYELKIVFEGEESETLILPKCETCEIYEGTLPSECPSGGTKGTQELDPGLYGVIAGAADSPLDPIPYVGVLTIIPHQTEDACFIVTENGIMGLGMNLTLTPEPDEESQETATPTEEVVATEMPTATEAAFDSGHEIPADIFRDGFTLGDPDAPVTVDEYADFQCSHCKTANEFVVTSLIDHYVVNGEIKLIFHSFNFLGQGSVDAANAAYCAGDQNKQWEMIEVLFANQTGFDQSLILEMGDFIGLEMDSFTMCVQNGTYYAQVQNDLDEGSAEGVTGTPTFLVNGTQVETGSVLSTVESLVNN